MTLSGWAVGLSGSGYRFGRSRHTFARSHSLGNTAFRRFHARLGISFGNRRACLRGGLARKLDLGQIDEHGFRQCWRRPQFRHFQQHPIGPAEFGFDKAARIGRRIGQIARRRASRAKTEAIERDKRGLRIAGHRISLEPSWAYIGGEYTAVRREPHMKNQRRGEARR
jgi:hypothetical protein